MQVLNFWSDLHRDMPLDIFVKEPFHFVNEYHAATICEVSPGLSVRVVRLEMLLQMKKTGWTPPRPGGCDELSLLHGLPSNYDGHE